jgi:hypothetical protein
MHTSKAKSLNWVLKVCHGIDTVPKPDACARLLRGALSTWRSMAPRTKKELVEGAVRFLAANYRLEKKGRQVSSKAPTGPPEISPGSGQSVQPS